MEKRVAISLLLLGLATGTYAALCYRPLTPMQCAAAFIVCKTTFVEANCTSIGGEFIPRGGACGICDLCVSYVGEAGQPCNTRALPTPTCRKPLKCSTANVCVEECGDA